MHAGLSLCRIDPCVGGGGGEVFEVSLDPVVGLGSHTCSNGFSVSRSVEESGVGQSPFLKYPCEHRLHQMCKEQPCVTAFNKYLTKSMEPNSSLEITRGSERREILRVFWFPKIHCHFHKSHYSINSHPVNTIS